MRILACFIRMDSPLHAPARQGSSSRPSTASRGILLVLALLSIGSPAFSATIRVPEDQPTIQSGIEAASFGDTVIVAPGRYYEHDLWMKSGICLKSQTGEMTCSIIDAQGLGRVMSCYSVDGFTRIEGFTFTNGYEQNAYGGAFLIRDSSPAISRCLFTGNTAVPGGSAIYCNNSNPTITQCAFLMNGQAIDGGCLNCTRSAPVLTECVMYGNSAQIWGGAIFCQISAPVLVRCTIVGNRAYQGGGIWCCYESQVTIEESIIASSTRGEGVYVYPDVSHPSFITLRCNDLFGNAGGNYGGEIEDQTGFNGNISEDPLFCGSDSADFRLASRSPCLPEYNECGVQMGALGQGCAGTAAVSEGGLPTSPTAGNDRIYSSAPNPFRAGDEIRFKLECPGEVSLVLIETAGRAVRHLLRSVPLPAGEGRVRWDGCDDSGRLLAHGLYFYRLESGRRVSSSSIVLLP